MVNIYNKKILVPLLTILITIALASIIYLNFSQDSSNEKVPVEPIDNDISPLTNQALFFQITRIRRRGLEEEIRQPGFTVPSPTPYYIKINIDGEEYDYETINAPQGSGSGAITDWDTGYGYINLIRNVEEEQESSRIHLSIIEEQEKRNLIFKKEIPIDLENIHLTYDYKTGRWDGDDFFEDTDGYGHYLGDECEIWFDITQTDYDHDGIPYWTEIHILKTNPKIDDSTLDPDGDNIPTSWEWKWGYDPLKPDNHSLLDPDQDGLSNEAEYSLEKWLSNPFYKDIYAEVDGMEGSGKFLDFSEYVLPKSSQQMVIEKFSQHHITLHIDDGWPNGPSNGGGEILPYIESMSSSSGLTQKFYHSNFAESRKGIFHYFVISHASGWTYPQDFTNSYDTSSLSGSREGYWNTFKLIPQGWFNSRMFYIWMASIFMHELGHQLGLLPDFAKEWIPNDMLDNSSGVYIGGIDNASHIFAHNSTFMERLQARNTAIDYWKNYYSCMSYGNSGEGPLKGLMSPAYAYIVLDYSEGNHGTNDFNDWDAIDLSFFKKTAESVEEYG